MNPRTTVPILLLGTAALVIGWWVMDDSRPPPEDVPSAEDAGAAFAGSDSCNECHPAEHAAWKSSHHFKNMQRPSRHSVIGDFEDAVYEYRGTSSRMHYQGAEYFMEYTDPEGETERLDIDYVLSVARHQVYLHQRPDGRLQVLPTYWNIEEQHCRDSTEGTIQLEGPLKTTEREYWDNWGRT